MAGREIGTARRNSQRFYCFVCTKKGTREAASVFLSRQEKPSDGFLWVPNIVPKELNELTQDQYNLILTEFHDRFAKPSADALNIQTVLSSSEQTLENWLGTVSVSALKIFSAVANKTTGSGHPLDRKRWAAFIIATHRARENPDVGLLQRWLEEEEHSPKHVTFDLIAEFQFGRSLLSQFDN